MRNEILEDRKQARCIRINMVFPLCMHFLHSVHITCSRVNLELGNDVECFMKSSGHGVP